MPPTSGYNDMHGYPETTDDESEDLFTSAPTPSQGPIMVSLLIEGEIGHGIESTRKS